MKFLKNILSKIQNNKKDKLELKEKKDKLMSEIQRSENPYLQARWEWNERYGGFIKDKNSWRRISYGLMIVVIICVVSFIYLASQSRITAFFVKTDQVGKPIYIEKIDPTTKLNSSVLTYQIGEFVTNVRTITPDGKLKKTWMQKAKRYCSEGAWNTLQEYWKNNPPEKLAETMGISVKIDSILPIEDSESWQVNWTETASKNGENIGSTRWTSIFNINVVPIKREEDFIENPTGLLIKSINWSRVK